MRAIGWSDAGPTMAAKRGISLSTAMRHWQARRLEAAPHAHAQGLARPEQHEDIVGVYGRDEVPGGPEGCPTRLRFRSHTPAPGGSRSSPWGNRPRATPSTLAESTTARARDPPSHAPPPPSLPWAASLRKTSPRCCLGCRYSVLLRHVGMSTTSRHDHLVCAAVDGQVIGQCQQRHTLRRAAEVPAQDQSQGAQRQDAACDR